MPTCSSSSSSNFLSKKLPMEVQIISEDIIKPSASTPPNLRTYKLSLLDQLTGQLYIPIILFYSPTSESSIEKSGRLKKSLSETLTHFYPLAGRIKVDGSCVDCRDDGVTYIETHIASDMSTVIQQPDIHQLQKLLPCDPYQKSPEISAQVLLAIQVNHFGCGGVAIGACIWHGVADAASLGTFLTSWAAIAHAGAANENIIDEVILDCTSLFPPVQDLLSSSLSDVFNEDQVRDSVMKRFVFDGSKIAALRGKIGNGPYLDCPTRVEALSALIWAAVMALTGEENDENTKTNTASLVVDIRKRMNPPLPQQSIGNIYQLTVANWPKEERVADYNRLARKIHDSIKLISSDYVRKLHSGNGLLDLFMKFVEEASKNPNSTFSFTSWCRFPFYEADFGWGKPVWVGFAMWLNKGCSFLDTRDGEGIEAWIGLSKKDMTKFEQNPDIIAYASFDPST